MANNNKIIPNRFWHEHKEEELGLGVIANCNINLLFDEEFLEKMKKSLGEELTEERMSAMEDEKQRFMALTTPEEIVKAMRCRSDYFNRPILYRKALDMQEEIMPLILRRYRTSCQDEFLEDAAIIFAHCEERYAVELREMYDDIRSPYAQALACVVFGIREDAEALPLMYRDYRRFQRNYPDKQYDECVLTGLWDLHNVGLA